MRISWERWVDRPERFNMASVNRHTANGGSIHFFGADQLNKEGLAKLHTVSPIFRRSKGMSSFLAIHGTKADHRRRRLRHERLESARDAELEPEMIAWLEKILK